MADEQQEQAPQPEPTTETTAPAETAGTDGCEKPDGFKSEESKNALLADLMEARQKLKAFEEADAQREREKLSDIERAQAERDDFRSKWEQAEQARIRSDVARTKGIDPDLLIGSTEEEFAAHADRLLAWRGDKPAPAPNPNPAQGRGSEHVQSDDDQLYNALYPKS